MTEQKQEVSFAEQMRIQYGAHEQTKLEQLRRLDRKAKRPAEIFAYSFGTAGALILGTGMSLAMGAIGASQGFSMPLGIAVGAVGMAVCSVNYLLYRAVLKSGKNKYGKKILALSDEILNG